ncbi:recombinase family protein [[Muricauda] lutisoli]|uniref:Recombinase family protein n=1 Tax=[Muricauda] lutisoli TaxID=2816035 RepID=A0ABS3EUE7_9FLAO|nr:recombinase family protein [[Muricauda] lutisoli]MBO0329762.1 recombinase family protein [[Muricauda] lutisoli]
MSNKCVLYLRVSSDLQDYQRQKDDLSAFAKSNSLIFGDDDVYEDKISGFKSEDERKGLSQLLNDISTKNIEVILVWELSRLSRSQSKLLQIKDTLVQNKVNIYFFQQSFWLFDKHTNKINPNAELLISFFGWNAEYEARLTKERFISAKKRYVREGKYNGGHITFGYTIGKFGATDNESDKKFIINEEPIEGLNVSEADIVREVFDLYENGDTCSKISLHCKAKGYPKHVCSPHTLARLLRNTSYIGYKDVKLGRRPVPPIIEESQFLKVGELLDKNKTKADKGRKHTYLLRGVLKCSYCENYYLGKQTDDAYQCSHNHPTNKHIKGTKCKGSNISISNLDGIIWERVKDVWVHKKLHGFDSIFETSKQEIEDLKRDVEGFEKLLGDIDNRRRKINRIYQNDGYIDDEYDIEIGKINKEKEDCTRRINELKGNIRSVERRMRNADKLSSRQNEINSVTDRKEMKSFISSLVMEVTFFKLDMFKTVVFVKYQDGNNETIIFNSVQKKKTVFKKIKSEYLMYHPEFKDFYLLKPKFRISKSSLVEFAKKKLDCNNWELPNELNSDVYDFEGIINLEDDSITEHEYQKITYFKDLNQKRFKRKK